MDAGMLATETAANNPAIALAPLMFIGALVWWGIKGMVNAHRENREVEANARLVKRFVRGELEDEADLKRAQLLVEAKGYSSTYEQEKARVESAGGTVSAASQNFDAAEPERRKREAERKAERERVNARAAKLEEEFAARNGFKPNVDDQVRLFHEAYDELVEPSDPLGYCTICGRGINPRAPRATVTDDQQYTHTKCARERRIAAKEVVEAPEVVPNSSLAAYAAELEAARVARVEAEGAAALAELEARWEADPEAQVRDHYRRQVEFQQAKVDALAEDLTLSDEEYERLLDQELTTLYRLQELVSERQEEGRVLQERHARSAEQDARTDEWLAQSRAAQAQKEQREQERAEKQARLQAEREEWHARWGAAGKKPSLADRLSGAEPGEEEALMTLSEARALAASMDLRLEEYEVGRFQVWHIADELCVTRYLRPLAAIVEFLERMKARGPREYDGLKRNYESALGLIEQTADTPPDPVLPSCGRRWTERYGWTVWLQNAEEYWLSCTLSWKVEDRLMSTRVQLPPGFGSELPSDELPNDKDSSDEHQSVLLPRDVEVAW